MYTRAIYLLQANSASVSHCSEQLPVSDNLSSVSDLSSISEGRFISFRFICVQTQTMKRMKFGMMTVIVPMTMRLRGFN